jgi:hypothetical protein
MKKRGGWAATPTPFQGYYKNILTKVANLAHFESLICDIKTLKIQKAIPKSEGPFLYFFQRISIFFLCTKATTDHAFCN